jgi:hypothetical protein
MVTTDDVELVLAYFLLSSPREYCPHEIAYRPTLRARFLKLAKRILGDVAPKEIIVRLLTMKNSCPERGRSQVKPQ